MKQRLLKSYLITLAVIIGFSFSTAIAQDFVSEGTSSAYNASCKGVIKIKSLTGTFVNNGTAVNMGQGESGNPIDGTVDYGATAAGQSVFGFYYTRLVLTGGNKSVNDGVRITGTECATPLAAYPDLANYPYYEDVTNVTYAGTFYYVGAGPATQTIFPQYSVTGGQPDNYNVLDLSGGGPKDILPGDVVGVGTINSDPTTTLSIAGGLNIGDGPSTFDGLVTLDNPAAEITVNNGDVTFDNNLTVNSGTLAVDGTGDAIVGPTSTLALVGNTSVIDLGPSTDLVITGLITNGGDGTNLDFDCLSTVTYNGTQNPQSILPTIATNAYGNLAMTGGAKRSGLGNGNNLYLCNNLALTGGNLDMYTNNGTLFMTNLAGTATYGGGTGNEEVEGKFNRTTGTAVGAYTFNNRFTTIDLAADVDNPTSIELNVRPGVNPNNYDGARDLNRKINLTYTGNAGDFAYEMSAGYQYTDRPNWNAPNTEASVRMYEADGVGTPDDVEKIGTGQTPTRQAAGSIGNLGYVSLAGILNGTGAVPNGIGIFASTHDVLLRTGPTTFYTIADGRWTNPNVWDEGTTPTAIDNAELRHSIYVGIDGPFINTTGGTNEVAINNTLKEATVYAGNVAAANQIVIAPKTGTPSPALIMGNEDNGDGYVFWTTSTTGYSLTNNNLNAPTVAYGSLLAKSTYENVASPFNGVWLTEYVTGAHYPTLKTNKLLNKGTINNDGVIEVGN